MSVLITIDKVINIDLFVTQLAAAGIRSSVRSDGSVVEILDSNDTAGVTAVYTAHDGAAENARLAAITTTQAGAVTGYQTLPPFLKTMTANEANAYIHAGVLGGKTITEVEADIDALAATIAGMKAGLKAIAQGVITLRDTQELIVKLLLYIRDLVIRFRQ